MKIKLQKIVGNLLDKLPKLYMSGTFDLEIFSRHQAIENSRKYLFLRFFKENSRWVPLFCLIILGKIGFSWWLAVATARGELELYRPANVME